MSSRKFNRRDRYDEDEVITPTTSKHADTLTDNDHSKYRELMKEPLIIIIFGCLIILLLICAIAAVYYLCSRRNKTRRSSRCSCNHAHDHGNRGHGCYHHPPPAYTPQEMHYRPEMGRCACQSHFETGVSHVQHRISSMTPLSQSGNGSQYRLTPCQERRSVTNRSLHEYPLLQQPERGMMNPVFDDSECEEIGNDRYPHGPLQELFKLTERSFSQTVCGKLLVSVARYVDFHGDTLILDNMGISLRVPEGAVKSGRKQWITLVLNWDLSDNPQMTKDQSLVSPVVYVGPHGMKLEKPCTLVYRHCSFDPRQIRVMRSETELTDDKSWAAICDQTDQSDVCYLTPDECQLKIDKFTLYTCVQSPIDDQIGKKWLQIAVFACPLRKEINHHQIRVYFLNKTPCALQWAIQNEATFGGKLVCPEKVFLFDGGDHDMFALTKYVSEGWEIVDTENMEKISFIKIWHGHCPHISVCYKRQASNKLQLTAPGQGQSRDWSVAVAIELSLNLLTYQNTLEDNGEKIFIQVAEDNVTPVTENEVACRRHHVDNIEINVNNYIPEHQTLAASGSSAAEVNLVRGNETSAGADTTMSTPERSRDTLRVNINNVQCGEDFLKLAKQIKPRTVPHELRQQLTVLLDPPKQIKGNDWRALAEKLQLDPCIPKLETLGNKTEHLMNVVESRHISLSQLKDMLYDMDRMDCVQAIDNFTGETERVSSRRAVESSESGYQTYMGQDGNRRNISSQMSWEDNTRPYNNSRVYAESHPSTRTAEEYSAYSRNPSINFYPRGHAHPEMGIHRQTEVGIHRHYLSDQNSRNNINGEDISVSSQDFSSRRAQFEQNNLSSPNSRVSGNNSRTHVKSNYQ